MPEWAAAIKLLLPMRLEPWPPRTPARTCPICGTWWRPWTGSFLPCHASCLFSPEDKRTIRRRALTEMRALDVVAAELGVPTSVVRAILDYGR